MIESTEEEGPPQPPFNKLFDRDKNLPISVPDWSPFAEIDSLGEILEQRELEKKKKEFGHDIEQTKQNDDDTLLQHH